MQVTNLPLSTVSAALHQRPEFGKFLDRNTSENVLDLGSWQYNNTYNAILFLLAIKIKEAGAL
jgi:hypothetical protein